MALRDATCWALELAGDQHLYEPAGHVADDMGHQILDRPLAVGYGPRPVGIGEGVDQLEELAARLLDVCDGGFAYG
jgi:hypothetical protein